MMYPNGIVTIFLAAAFATSCQAKKGDSNLEANNRVTSMSSLGFSSTGTRDSAHQKTPGKVAGHPAWALGTSISSPKAIVVNVGKSKTATDARSQCSKLAPRGQWRLPTYQEYGSFLMVYDIVNEMPFQVKHGQVLNSAYPLFAETGDLRTTNGQKYRDEAVTMVDGQGAAAMELDIQATLNDIRQHLQVTPSDETAKAMQNFLKDGISVYCIAGSLN